MVRGPLLMGAGGVLIAAVASSSSSSADAEIQDRREGYADPTAWSVAVTGPVAAAWPFPTPGSLAAGPFAAGAFATPGLFAAAWPLAAAWLFTAPGLLAAGVTTGYSRPCSRPGVRAAGVAA